MTTQRGRHGVGSESLTVATETRPTMYSPHVLIAFGGSLGNPALDVWACTIKIVGQFSFNDTMSVAEQLEYATAAETPLTTWFTDASGMEISSGAILEYIKVNSIDANGHYVHPTTTEIEVTPHVSGGTGFGVSWRQSLVVTMRPTYSRGPAAFGRFYPPLAVTVPSVNSPYITGASASDAATSTATMLNALNQIVTSGHPSGWQVANVSRINGAVGPVRSIEIDHVPDTQRRRTNRVPRLVSTAAVTV